MNKKQKINEFDISGIAVGNNIFGLPFNWDDAEIIVIPVPWEVTVSYNSGTAKGPQAVLDASFQVDLYDPNVEDAWKIGIAIDKINPEIKKKSDLLRKKVVKYIDLLAKGQTSESNSAMKKVKKEVNIACLWLNKWVKERSEFYLNKNKIVALLGGDHSTPLGLMQAVAQRHSSFAILQVDAHADLRDAYEGFDYSHASIMYNALKIQQVKKLVQVGIRDYCQAELDIIKDSKGKITTFFDRDIKNQQYKGETWSAICDQIVQTLPDKVFLSFDIDGLDPKLCPHTGTPVAGGFEFEQAVYLIEKVVSAGKQIIAFDINEVAPGKDEWDANVGARLLYRIANLVAKSNGRVSK